MLRPGTFLQDRYEIQEQVGSGGMSVVYKAKCHKLNRMVAIKVLKEEFCNDAGFVSKFKMEAQAAAGLSHPNIVSVYDVIDEGKLHYIVMELVEGITLKSYIAKKGRLEVKESIGIAIQVAQGIAAAHEQHIIHRDIKPQNMIISRDGKVKVADFGIARAVSAQTLNSAAMGSVHYISPEQARGGFSDERSDIYSLGITMYEMVTGRVPYEGENTVSIALAHLEDAMVPPSVYNPQVPVSLERIILKCTEKKPERRYPDVNDVIADLRKVLVDPEHAAVAGKRQIPERQHGDHAVNGETVQISGEELNRIKEWNRPKLELELTRNLDRDFKEEPAFRRYRDDEPEAPRNYRESGGRKVRRDGHGDSARRADSDDDASPGIERLLTGAGVIVAAIIVIVLIVVFSKLGGLFKSGSGLWPGSGTEVVSSGAAEGDETLSSTEIAMPKIEGLTEDEAEAQLAQSFITMKRSYAYFDDIAEGVIASQDPAPGATVLKGGSVNVVVSSGSDKLNLTDLGIGNLDGTTAEKFLASKNVTVKLVEEESETVEKGKILRYEPELVAEGGTVTLYVSTGPHVDLVAAPYLIGKPEEEAIALLAEAGLSPGSTETASSDTVARGSVISQDIGAGTQLEPGSKISYVVSSGPEVHKQRYVASINEVFDLSYLIGPGAGSSSVTVMIRLRQGTDSDPVYRVLTQATTVRGDVLLPVSYTSIESVDGTDKGELEIVDVDSGAVIETYPLTFFPMD
ncbi:MAG: Stk1 family PASTA domain-containing Ser/Thr kinase [Eubacteriales bacterium]|nr:Stk1 family PASTA domain-containing Ser/Thr kinase [Eubacteriales bacterium]